MKFTIPLLALILVLAACQPNGQPTAVLPTVAVLPGASTSTVLATEAKTEEATAVNTSEVTETVVPEVSTETSEPSATMTRTLRPMIATNTVEPTQAAIGTSTQAVLEAPLYATFTAGPAGTLPPASGLNQVADVVINEQQFQEEINAQLLSLSSIQSAVVDFVPGEIHVKMITSGVTPISGIVTIPVTLVNDLASITISDITSDQQPVPQSYIDVATGDLFVMMVNSLDNIVKARIGPEQKLKNITVTDTSIGVTMLVP